MDGFRARSVTPEPSKLTNDKSKIIGDFFADISKGAIPDTGPIQTLLDLEKKNPKKLNLHDIALLETSIIELHRSSSIPEALKERLLALSQKFSKKTEKQHAEEEFYRHLSQLNARLVLDLQRQLHYRSIGQKTFLAFLLLQPGSPDTVDSQSVLQTLRKLPRMINTGLISSTTIDKVRETLHSDSIEKMSPYIKTLYDVVNSVLKMYDASMRNKLSDKENSIYSSKDSVISSCKAKAKTKLLQKFIRQSSAPRVSKKVHVQELEHSIEYEQRTFKKLVSKQKQQEILEERKRKLQIEENKRIEILENSIYNRVRSENNEINKIKSFRDEKAAIAHYKNQEIIEQRRIKRLKMEERKQELRDELQRNAEKSRLGKISKELTEKLNRKVSENCLGFLKDDKLFRELIRRDDSDVKATRNKEKELTDIKNTLAQENQRMRNVLSRYNR